MINVFRIFLRVFYLRRIPRMNAYTVRPSVRLKGYATDVGTKKYGFLGVSSGSREASRGTGFTMWSSSPLLALLLLSTTAEAARILTLFGFPAKSHVGAYTPYLEALAKRGHELTVLTAFPRKTSLPNYTEIIVQDTLKINEKEGFNVFQIGEGYFLPMIFFFFLFGYENCEKLLQEPNMQKLIHSKDQEFDLVVYEPFFTECTYGLVHKYKAPTIQILPNTIMPIMGNSVGNPSTVSYIPELMVLNDLSSFSGRLLNFLRIGYIYLFRKFFVIPRMDALIRKYYPDPTIPSIEEIETNTTFLFLHSHPILTQPRPLTPNTIEVGGLHITGPKSLPQDLKKFLDEAPHGVIYFSLGSNVRSVDMPETMRNAILNTFAKLKQKVLWKWEADILPGQPANVRLGKWLPQHDILAHPNLKLFITHGGLMSLQEAVYFGVPLVAVPVLADQKLNTLCAQNAGFAISLNIHNITEKTLSWAIQEVLHEPRYYENVQQFSKIFRDQPEKPLDRAIFWTEYAIRHKGAPHMRSAGLKLNIFQFYLVDVIAFLSVLGIVFMIFMLGCIKMTVRCLCSKSNANNVSISKKRN